MLPNFDELKYEYQSFYSATERIPYINREYFLTHDTAFEDQTINKYTRSE